MAELVGPDLVYDKATRMDIYTYINHSALSQASPVKRRVQVMVRLRVSSRPELHAFGEPLLSPSLLLSFPVISHKVPIRLALGKAEREPNSRVGRLLAITKASQCLRELRVGQPYLIQIEGNPVVEYRVLEKGCRRAGVRNVAGPGLAEDAGGHGVAEDAVHAVLWEADLRGYIGVGHLAMERDQVRDLEFHNDLQCREIMLDLYSSLMSLLLLLVRVRCYPIRECSDAVFRSKR